MEEKVTVGERQLTIRLASSDQRAGLISMLIDARFQNLGLGWASDPSDEARAVISALEWLVTSPGCLSMERALLRVIKLEQVVAEQHIRPIMVSKREDGEVTTIQEAIRRAAPGALILVRPGIYDEPLVIDKPLRLVAHGLMLGPLIRTTGAPSISVESDGVEIEGFGVAVDTDVRRDSDRSAIHVIQGKLELLNCDVASDASCILVSGERASATLRHCNVHHGALGGLVFEKTAGGLVEECAIFENKCQNIEIREGADPVLRRCKIYNGGNMGVFAWAGGKGLLDECSIEQNAGCGVFVKGHADPRFRKCNISRGRSTGVCVSEDGRGAFETCEITANRPAGVHIRDGGSPVLRHCTVGNNEQWAIQADEAASGHVDGCDLRNNPDGAWLRRSSCNVRMSDNLE